MRARVSTDRGISAKPPFRDAKLTRLLRPCFDSAEAMTLVIATVSPGSSDTEHAMDTLAHCCMMKEDDAPGGLEVRNSNVEGLADLKAGVDPSSAADGTALANDEDPDRQAGRPLDPSKWTMAEVCEWFVEAATEAVEEVKAEIASTSNSAPSTFEVAVGCKAYLALKRDPNAGLGLSFDKTTADDEPPV